MTGILSSTIGTFRSGIIVTEMAKVQNKTAGTNNLNSGSINMVAGREYHVLLSFDPSGASAPTVSLSDTVNTYATTLARYQAPSTTSAGTGVVTQALRAINTVTATRTITATFSASITAKCMVVLEIQNTTGYVVGSGTDARGTGTAVSLSSSAGQSITDMTLSFVGWESPTAIVSGPTDTVGGVWSTLSQISTTGGTANTNIGIGYAYKINTSNGGRTAAYTLGASPNNWAGRCATLQQKN
jgi:hypothetical protein